MSMALERLIPVVNKLQDIFHRCGLGNPIDLPQIVVVGAQSSGKSSVLEAIVGFDFLPRGSGVVTRRPTVLQLNKLAADGKGPRMWVEFKDDVRKYTSVSEIQSQILKLTERVAGVNKSLNPTPLLLRVFSTDVVDLTLIDLPGLTRVPVGDQPEDIEKLVRVMVHSYIEKKNTIILAVHPANTDLATSDALMMARAVDPEGVRTLGVLTKLDLMDDGTNALDILQGRVIPLRRGYVGVVNRSQADLDNAETISLAQEAERRFFQNHPIYAPHAAKMGSKYLASLLSSMLMEHIRKVLPDIRTKLTSQLEDVRLQLAELGPALTSSDDSSATLLHMLTRYASAFANALDGRPHSPIATSELAGGARISYIFHERFGHDLAAMDAFEGLGSDEIRTALRNATGHRTPLFIPESAFELLVKRQIVRFLSPSLACVDLVYDELTRLAISVEGLELARFRRLREAVADATLQLLRKQKAPTVQMVRNLIDMEMSHINTWHPDFVGGKQALTAIVQPALLSSSSNVAEASQYETNSSSRTPQIEPAESWIEKNLLGHRTSSSPVNANGVPDFRSRSSGSVSSPTSRGRRGLAYATSSSGGIPQRNINGLVSSTKESFGISQNNASLARTEQQPADDENQELSILRILLESYFNIVRKRLQDMVPKAIITFLVQKCKDELQSVLVANLYKPASAEALMVEADDTAQRRKDLMQVASMLEEALQEVGEVRDIN